MLKYTQIRDSDFFKQIMCYLLALFIPGAVNFLALTVYTRLLSAEEYGNYTFLLAIILNVKFVVFEWLKLGFFRYFQNAEQTSRMEDFLFTVKKIFTALSLIVLFLASVFLLSNPIDHKNLDHFIWLGFPFLITYSIYDMLLQANRSAIEPFRYGVLSASRSLLSLACAVLLILWIRKDYKLLLLGITIGTWASCISEWNRWNKKAKKGHFKKEIFQELIKYSLPIALSALLAIVVSTSDRILLNYFLGPVSVGLFSAGYDLADQSLTIIFMVLNLSIYPIILKTAEKKGEKIVREQMELYLIIITGLTIPAALILAAAANSITQVLLGQDFRQAAGRIMPWIVLATFLKGIKVYYFDLCFQIGMRTHLQVWNAFAAAITNIGLNIWWIPKYGIMGAVYASVLSYFVSLVVSIFLGRLVLKLSMPVKDLAKIGVGCLFSILFIIAVPGERLPSLIAKIVGSGAIYIFLIWYLNIADSKQAINSAGRQFISYFHKNSEKKVV